MTRKPEIYKWMDEEEVEDFILAFIIKASERGYCASDIAEYLVLSLRGLEDAQKERKLEG